MLIQLIRPPIDSQVATLTVPENLLILGTYALRAGHSVKIIDFDALTKKDVRLRNRFFDSFTSCLSLETPSLFGFTSMSPSFPYVALMSIILKKAYPALRIVVGGPHSTAIPERVLLSTPSIDFAVVGEGQIPLAALADQLARSSSEYSTIKNLCYRDADGRIISNDRIPLVLDLDDQPLIDYSLIDMQEYKKHKAFPIYAGTGCPHNCSFCSTKNIWQRKFRAKSPARLIRDIRNAQAALPSGADPRWDFSHDNLFAGRPYLDQLCEALKTEKVQWSASARLDYLNDHVLSTIAASGCRALFLGIESGSQTVQRAIKKNLDLSRLLPTVRRAKELNIDLTLSFIIGFPEESIEDLYVTLDLAMQAKLAHARNVQIHTLTAFDATAYENELSDITNFRSTILFLPTDDRQLVQAYVMDPRNSAMTLCYRAVKNSIIGTERFLRFADFVRILIPLYPYTVRFLRAEQHLAYLDIFDTLKVSGVDYSRFMSELVSSEETAASFAWDRLPLDEPSRIALFTLAEYETFKRTKVEKDYVAEKVTSNFDLIHYLKDCRARFYQTPHRFLLKKSRSNKITVARYRRDAANDAVAALG